MNRSASSPAMPAELSVTAGVVLLLSLSFLWGGTWPAMKAAVSEIPIFTFRIICLYGGALGMFALARLGGLSLRVPRNEWLPLVIVTFFNITVWHICSAAGLTFVTAGRAAIIAYTMPLWATLLSVWLLNEKLRLSTILGLAVGLAGLAVLLAPEWRLLLADPRGPLFMLLAAMGWAAGTVGLKYCRFSMPVVPLVGWQLILGGIPLLIAAPFFDRGVDPASWSWHAWLGMIYAVLAAMIFCHWAWFKLVRSFSAVTISINSLAIPVVGVLSSALLLGESIGADVMAGLGLIILAQFLAVIWPALARRA
ncbi:MAG TPA: DMT family transporter [Dongiaceae bacterium]|jgi:drug/metabolite transporter (DMT)-like permease